MTPDDRHPMTGNMMTDQLAPEGHGFEEHTYDVVVDRRRRRRTPRRDRRPRRRRQGRDRLQVAARQGAHGDGRGRHRRGDGQPLARGQLAGPLPRHHARRQDAQPLADGAAARAGGARAGASSSRSGARCSTALDNGLISQRDFGGHRYARLAHVGDRTGLEMIRTLQQRAVALGIDVFMECTVTEIFKDDGRVSGAFGYWRESGRFIVFKAPSVVLATGGIGKSYQVTSNSWEYTGDGHALALRTGATLINMEFVQFHPTGMVWPPSVKGLLVTESVRGDGGVLRNSEGKRFMFDYIPEFFKAETADTEEEADRWYDDKKNNRRPPELLPRDEVARAINSEIKAGRGSPHGGVFLDIASRRTPEFIRRRLPSMYHQFKELADVDITAEPMEIGPTCHYVMGGVEVDPDTGVSLVEGLYAAGEVAGGMHGSNRLGGNSLVRPAGVRSPRRAQRGVLRRRAAGRRCRRSTDERGRRGGRRARSPRSRSRAARTRTRSSTTCRTSCSDWSASSAPRDELEESLTELDDAQGRASRTCRSRDIGSTTPAGTSRSTSPTCCRSPSASPRPRSSARSRAAATPATTSPAPTRPGDKNLVLTLDDDGDVELKHQPLPQMPADLKAFFDA